MGSYKNMMLLLKSYIAFNCTWSLSTTSSNRRPATFWRQAGGGAATFYKQRSDGCL